MKKKMTIWERIWDAITAPFVAIAILLEEGQYYVYETYVEKKGDEDDV